MESRTSLKITAILILTALFTIFTFLFLKNGLPIENVRDFLEGLVIVVPTQDLDLFEQIEVREVVEQLLDKGAIDLGIEGIAGEVVLEVVEQSAGLGGEDELLGEDLGCGLHEILLGIQSKRSWRASATSIGSMVSSPLRAASSKVLRQRWSTARRFPREIS